MNANNITVGIIGGSGLYQMDGLTDVEEIDVTTPFGSPSDRIVTGWLGSVRVAFVARHGRHHTLLPSEVPYRANIYALKQLGVRYLLSVSAVGSLQEAMRPRDIVLPDQFIDRTCRRDSTFFGDGVIAHVAFATPVCPALNGVLAEAIRRAAPDMSVHVGGTYVCIEGPAFSTLAESMLYRQWSASVVGMTNVPEGVIVLFVQNLAVSFEIPRKIIGLARGRFRETVSSGCKIWRFSPQRRPDLTAPGSQPAATSGRRPAPPALSAPPSLRRATHVRFPVPPTAR